MRQIMYAASGEPDVLRLCEAAIPALQAGEVLVKVDAAGVNRPDILQRQGKYPLPPHASPILGLEIAGTIARIGNGVSGFAPGDKVCALTNGGGYADYCAVPAGQILPWPEHLNAVEAAALPETLFTVWANIFEDGCFAKGETVLVHGGSSGIGTTAIQLVKAMGGKVFVTAGKDEKCAACLCLGADAAFNYNTQNFAEEIKALTNGKGVDIILDCVGAPYFERNIASLGVGGRLLIIGFLGGAVIERFNLGKLMARQLSVKSSALRPRTHRQKAELATALRRSVWPLIVSQAVKPVIAATFPLQEAAKAHALMESSQHIGKIVLTV